MPRKKSHEEYVAEVAEKNPKKYIVDNEELMKEWDFSKNETLNLYPKELLQYSNKYVWWRCGEGHSWSDSISHRASGRNCPFCSSHKILVGYNDLFTLNPNLAKEWNYKRNGDLRPTDVMQFSNKKVWWTCPNGHEYKSTVARRSQGHGCKYCQGSVDKDKDKYNIKLHKVHKNIDLIDEYTNVDDDLHFICRICGSIFISTPHRVLRSSYGCPVCAHSQIGPSPEYKNSIWESEFNELFEYYGLTEEQCKAIMPHSGKKILMKCPICGNIKNISPDAVLRNGFGCRKCSDGISYPEKFMMSLLDQLDVEYTTQYSPSWITDRRYDFYLPDYNCIIETHGLQHYEETNLIKLGVRTLKKEQDNDILKENVAKQNGIINYFIIDCRESNVKWIKNHIIDSGIQNLLHFTEESIDWNKCARDAIKTKVKDAAVLWGCGESITNIAIKLHTTRKTINQYLKIANELNLCDYSVKESYNRMGKNNLGTKHPNHKSVVQYDLNMNIIKMWDCISCASNELNITQSNISMCCTGKRKTAGGFIWRYADEIEEENLKGEK